MKNKRGLSLITIMIIVAVTALALRIAIEQIMQINISQNEDGAIRSLKLVSTALENYAKDHQGVYPQNLYSLVTTNPSYLSSDYTSQGTMKGYAFGCQRLDPSGYSCTATPLKCRINGKKIFTITTGGSLAMDDCMKKE
jgi:competence protein ComGC